MDYLFVGTYGHVLALDKATGEVVWDTSLPSTGYSVVSILPEEGALYCASGGRVFALDPDTGDIVWDNGLPGMGMGHVYLATGRRRTEGAIPVMASEAAERSAHHHHGTN